MSLQVAPDRALPRTLDDPRLLTPDEAAKLLGVSKSTVKRHAHELGGVYVGSQWRFSLGGLNFALKNRVDRRPASITHRRPA